MALKEKLEKCWYKEKLMKQEQNRNYEDYQGLKGKCGYEKWYENIDKSTTSYDV